MFVKLSEKPTDREIEISRLKGVALYRLITRVQIEQGDHALSLGSEKVTYSYARHLATDPTGDGATTSVSLGRTGAKFRLPALE